MPTRDQYKHALRKSMCEEDHLYFTRYFFKCRTNRSFIVNWHHYLIADTVDDIVFGRKNKVVIEVSPGGTKTELVVINLIARGLALNPRSRFLHLSGSESLTSLNSATARDIVRSQEFQNYWPMKISEDADSKKRWNVEVDGKIAGGVYATAIGGQVTGFRAGHMEDGFCGALLMDDLIKPEDAFSKSKIEHANRRLITTVQSRLARPDTPIILIMQRLGDNDPAAFIRKGNLGDGWEFVTIPAVLDEKYVKAMSKKYLELVDPGEIVGDRFSYWPKKQPIKALLEMERGGGMDENGQRVSRHVFQSQYQQTPKRLGGNVIKGSDFVRYTILPQIKYRKVYADTAQKAKQRNDFSVFEEWGLGNDGRIYLMNLMRGKWEAPELQRRAIAFWSAAKSRDVTKFGQCRAMRVEDKVSGTGLIQTLKLPPYNIPMEEQQRNTDKVLRVNDGLPYIEAGQVCIPEDAPYTNDFVAECEAFTEDDTHDFDDQIDPMLDAIDDMASSGNKMKIWQKLGEKTG